MHAALLLNERSRRGRREAGTVCAALEDSGVECSRDPADPRAEAIVAAGGDGTVIAAIPLAIERGLPLGIVPLGTFNDLARTLGVPLGVTAACEAIAAGKTRTIDVGRVNGTYFVNEASVGLSSRIARRQTPQLKQRFGYAGVAWTALRGLAEMRAFHAEIRYDGRSERFSTVQLTVANNARFGGIIERSDAAIDDGWLDLYSVETSSIAGALRVFWKVLRRDAGSGAGLRTRRARAFEVVTHHPHRITADGEPAGVTPARFEVLPRSLRVIVP